MKQTTIEAGYRLSINSWENDGDHRKTKVLEGLSKELVQFYVELLKLFKSQNYNDDRTAFGNMYEPEDYLLQNAADAIKGVADAHRGTLDALDPGEYDYVTGYPCDYVGDYLLGYSEHYTYRVFESFKVQLVPSEIVLQDVTDLF